MERDLATSGGANGSPQGQQLQEAASGLMEQAARTADAQASTTMTRVGETLQTVASHIRQAGQELESSQPQVAGFIDTAAEQVEHAATYLRDRDASEALDNVQRIARNQPALVIGGGLAVGLIIGRLLRGGAETASIGHGDSSSGSGLRGTRYEAYGDAAMDSPVGLSGTGPTTAGTVVIDATVVDDDELLSDSATGDAVRDEAPTVRG
jgi:ElaB/YqjD/DUF883 family membrane-anchored ribosome-binding protein